MDSCPVDPALSCFQILKVFDDKKVLEKDENHVERFISK